MRNLALLLLTVAATSLRSASPQSPTSPKPEITNEEEMPKEAEPAVKALQQFLAATTLAERLRYTLQADAMKPLMERYYKQAPEGPVLVDRIQFIRFDPNTTPSAGRTGIFNLESKAWQFSVPVMLQEEPDGFKVEWPAFIEFKDGLLEKFFKTYQKEPMRFHVGIQRNHCFDQEIPGLASKDSFCVTPAPPNSFQGNALLGKDTDLAKELRTSMPWETHVWAVVELAWKKQDSQQWVEVKSVPQMHWYSLPADPQPIPSKK